MGLQIRLEDCEVKIAARAMNNTVQQIADF
jgi:hypothetical protein